MLSQLSYGPDSRRLNELAASSRPPNEHDAEEPSATTARPSASALGPEQNQHDERADQRKYAPVHGNGIQNAWYSLFNGPEWTRTTGLVLIRDAL